MCIRDRADIDAAKKDLETAKAALAEIDTASKDDGHLTALMQRSEEIETSRSELTTRRSANEQQQAKSRQRLGGMEAIAHRAEAIQADVATLNSEAEALLGDGGTESPYIQLTVNAGRYQAWLAKEEESLAALKRERDQVDQDLEVQELSLIHI